MIGLIRISSKALASVQTPRPAFAERMDARPVIT